MGVRRNSEIERLAVGVDVLSAEEKDKDEEEEGSSEYGFADVKVAASNAMRAVKTSFFRGVLTILFCLLLLKANSRDHGDNETEPSKKSKSKGSSPLKKHGTSFKHSDSREEETRGQKHKWRPRMLCSKRVDEYDQRKHSTVREEKQIETTCTNKLAQQDLLQSASREDLESRTRDLSVRANSE